MDDRYKTTEKMTDKAFSRSMIALVLGILLCATCLCSATWAWFNTDAAAQGNQLATGNFGLEVTVLREGDAPITLPMQADGKATYTFTQGGIYTVELKMTADTTVSKGFCSVVADGVVHSTAVIGSDATSFAFVLDVRAADTVVVFAPSWGYPSASELVEANEILVIPVVTTP